MMNSLRLGILKFGLREPSESSQHVVEDLIATASP